MLIRNKYTCNLKQRIKNFAEGVKTVSFLDVPFPEVENAAMREIYHDTYNDVCKLEISAMQSQNVKNLTSASEIMNAIIPLQKDEREFANYMTLTINVERVAKLVEENPGYFTTILDEWNARFSTNIDIFIKYLIRICRFVVVNVNQSWVDDEVAKRNALITMVYEAIIIRDIKELGIETYKREITTRNSLLLPMAFFIASCGKKSPLEYLQQRWYIGVRETMVERTNSRLTATLKMSRRMKTVFTEIGPFTQDDPLARNYLGELMYFSALSFKMISPVPSDERKMEVVLCSAEVYIKVAREMPQQVEEEQVANEEVRQGDGNIDRLLDAVVNERRIDPIDIIVDRGALMQEEVAREEVAQENDSQVAQEESQVAQAARTERNRRKKQQRKARLAEIKSVIGELISEVCADMAMEIRNEIKAEREKVRDDAIAEIIASIVDETMTSIAEIELMAKVRSEAMASVLEEIVQDIAREEVVAVNAEVSSEAQARVLFDARTGAQFSNDFSTEMAQHLFSRQGPELITLLTRDSRALRNALIRSFLQANFAEDKPECFMCLGPLQDLKSGFFASCCAGASYVCAECVEVDHGHSWVVRPALERAVGL